MKKSTLFIAFLVTVSVVAWTLYLVRSGDTAELQGSFQNALTSEEADLSDAPFFVHPASPDDV